jgi:hypothetical protein
MASNQDTKDLYWFRMKPYILCQRPVSTCFSMPKCSKRLTTRVCKLQSYGKEVFEERKIDRLEESLAPLYSRGGQVTCRVWFFQSEWPGARGMEKLACL